MPLDDARLAELLARDRDALVVSCKLPTATQALLRARLHAARRRAARVSAFIDQLMLAAGSVVAMAAATATLLYVPLSDRVSIVVLGTLSIGGVAVLTALVAMRTNSFESRYRGGRVGP